MTKVAKLASLLFALAFSQSKPFPVLAKDTGTSGGAFHFIKSYRDVKSDPDKIWDEGDLAPKKNGTVSIFEYELETGSGAYLISQIWNDNCSISVCPTRLIKLGQDGSKKILVDDMMHQVIPADAPNFESSSSDPKTKEYASAPFVLSKDGKHLINSDYKFDIGG